MAWYDAPRYISEGISQGIIDKFNQAKLGQILDEMQQTKQLRTTLGNLPQDITPEQRMTTIGEALMRTGQYPQGAAILDTLYRTNAISQINQQRMTRQEAQKAINEATGYIRTGNLAGFKAMLDNPSIQDNPLIKNRYGDISDPQVQSKLISAYFNENNPAWKRTQQITKKSQENSQEYSDDIAAYLELSASPNVNKETKLNFKSRMIKKYGITSLKDMEGIEKSDKQEPFTTKDLE